VFWWLACSQAVSEAASLLNDGSTISSFSESTVSLPSIGYGRRDSQTALADAPLPLVAKPDVGVKSKAAALASQVSSLRAATEGTRQAPIRTGALLTSSMRDAMLSGGSVFGSSYGKLAMSQSGMLSSMTASASLTATSPLHGTIGSTYAVP
jgi:hypothetical protein